VDCDDSDIGNVEDGEKEVEEGIMRAQTENQREEKYS
jgi:hypothetical protein